MDYFKESLKLHRKLKGKLSINSKMSVKTARDLSLLYTPGVAAPSQAIAHNKKEAFNLTIKSNTVGVFTDGSSVLGLGNIGPEASLPVMEGKCALFKELGGVNAFPLPINAKDEQDFIATAEKVSPAFAGINLEDIAAPHCFVIENELKKRLGIPVFHDDQHGTAIVVLAALLNACKITKKPFTTLKIVILGAGAAGSAIAKILACGKIDRKVCIPAKEVIVVDSKGIISNNRQNLAQYKKNMLEYTNPANVVGKLKDAMDGADVFIGVSKPNMLSSRLIELMGEKPVIFAMANPIPEIMPAEAKKAGAFIIGTGRSDFPNQINNALAFPGIFRGTIDARARSINDAMKLAAAHALADFLPKPTKTTLLPSLNNKKVHAAVARAVKKAARDTLNVRS
jgi:malate dehydrogenase (oxaloacetate-decarboxylating)